MINSQFLVNGVSFTLVYKNKIVLQLRDNKIEIPNPNVWCFNSGRISDGEFHEEAVRREMFEELGYLSKNPIFYKSEILPFPYYGKREVQVFRYYEIYDGVQKINCFEGQKVDFFSLDEIKKLKTVAGTYELAKSILKLAGKSSVKSISLVESLHE